MLEKLQLLAFLSHLGAGAVSQCCREQLDVAPNPSEQGPGGHHPQALFPLFSSSLEYCRNFCARLVATSVAVPLQLGLRVLSQSIGCSLLLV